MIYKDNLLLDEKGDHWYTQSHTKSNLAREHDMVTVAFSGLFDTIQATGHTLLETEPLEKRTSKLFRHEGYRELKELMLTLNGATSGTAAATFDRVAPDNTVGAAPGGGGQRTIDTITVINRSTVAGDITRIADMLNEIFVPASYPADPSSNGGGGQLEDQSTL